MVERYFGRKGVCDHADGGGRRHPCCRSIAAAARLGLPTGRLRRHGARVPELQMVTFTIGGVSATPMALTDEKGQQRHF